MISIPLFIGLYFLLFKATPITLEELEQKAITAQKTSSNEIYYEITTFTRAKKRPLTIISLNDATLEDLIKQPEIGIKYASLILDERKKRIFSNWEDFSNRLKTIGKDKLDKLREQGLKVNCD